MQLNKLKSGIRNGTEVTLKLLSNVVGDSNNENNLPHKLLLTRMHISKLSKTCQIIPQLILKLSKSQLHKIGQSGWLLGRLLVPLLKTGLSFMKNVLKPLAKIFLVR